MATSTAYDRACADVARHIASRRDPRLPPVDIDDDAEDEKPRQRLKLPETDEPVPPPGGGGIKPPGGCYGVGHDTC